MRLLHLNQSARIVSKDFRGKPIPPYAILSHTWGVDEVLFQDLGSDACKEKDGYRKLEFCAKQAAEDKLQYFWIDTCCIDKWNVLERSRAINSMFQWYKNATKCYVFLEDVSVSTATETHRRSYWEASFRTSKWFTRGWTLQELIAPVVVEFFSCEGQRIGDKTSLKQLIHEITSIPQRALQNCSLDRFTIPERMQWAENRETTEEEDIVYCLLGILGIFMPISYNEGREKALGRLLAEVEATTRAPSVIPFSQNHHFVGRESQLAELEAKLFSNKQSTTLAIVGPGGTGKSQLALELAYRTKEKHKNCSVFWLDASDSDSLYQSYARIAQKLDIPRWDNENADVKQIVKLHLEAKNTGQCLLIFDNAEGMDSRFSNPSTPRAANVIDYLPQSELCSVVFTTTNSNTARLASQDIVELWELTPEAARKCWKITQELRFLGLEQQEAKLLLQELSNLPLAIVQAAAYINNTGITIQQYRSQMGERAGHALEHNDEPGASSTNNAVAATLIISMDQIRRHNALAADYLCIAACVDSKDIPLDLLEASSSMAREDAIKVLSRYALVTRRPAESAFDIHRLVHRAMREWLQKQMQLGQWTQNAIRQLLQVFPDHDDGNRSKWRRLLPHAKYAVSYDSAEGENDDRLTLVRKYAATLYSDGRYDEAEGLFVQVMETRKRVLGDEHPSTLISMNNLASTYRDQGRWKEAEELEVQVMETRKRVLGNEHLSTLTSMGNLASTYWNQGRWKEAEELDVQVMETNKRVLGDEHPDTLISMANLASTYMNQGRWKEAEELEVQVMETRQRALGDEHPDTLTSMNNLASTYWTQGRWKEAEELGVQVMEKRKRVLGDEHPDTLTSMNNLASTYMNQGRWKEAEELEVQVMETRQRALGDEHPDTLISMNNLASTYWTQGRWKEAEELGVQVMEKRKRVLGDKHPDTLTSMNNLAFTLKSQNQDEEALSLLGTCFELHKQILGEQHPNTKLIHTTLDVWQAENSKVAL